MVARSKGVPKVTIQDVARLAGVGAGTVSRVLNATPNVSQATRRRVVAAIEEMGFRPDAAARALRSRRTGTVGAAVPFFTKHFYVEVLRAIARATAVAGLGLIVFDIERPEERERVLRGQAAGSIVDGLIVVSLVPTEEETAAINAGGINIVLIDGFHSGLDCVEIDHAHGGYIAVSHLAQLGHRRIGLIDRPEDPLAAQGFSVRMDGYRRALEEAHLLADSALMKTGEYSRESGRETMERLLGLAERPTAVFAASDLQAIGAMEAMRSRGLRVPEDVAVVGYNDIELAEYIGLTTIRLPTNTIGEVGVKLLGERLAGEQAAPRQVQLRGELVVRRTSGGRCGGSLPLRGAQDKL